jgi:hypothetical protein
MKRDGGRTIDTLERVGFKRAFHEVLGSPRLVRALALGALIALLPYVGVDASGRKGALALGLSLAGSALVFGYEISYAHRIARGPDGHLPPLASLAHLRRGISGTLVVELPALLLFLPAALLSLLRASAPEALTPALFALSALGLASWFAFVVPVFFPVIAGARYAYHDRLVEGLRYGDAIRKAMKYRRALAPPVLFAAAWTVVAVSARYALGIVLGSRMLVGLRGAVVLLATGHPSVNGALLVSGAVVLAVLDVGATLLSGHLLGQYAAIAFRPKPATLPPADVTGTGPAEQADSADGVS